MLIAVLSTAPRPTVLTGPPSPGFDVVVVSWLRAHGFGPAIKGIDTLDDAKDARTAASGVPS